jgi:DNA-binding NarL/FixJ family response regulator
MDEHTGKERQNVSALIVAEPGPLRDSLYFMLHMMPGIDTVNYVSDAAWALRAVAERQPDLVILDGGLANDKLDVLKTVQSDPSQCPCLVLADDVQQQQRFKSAGADTVLLKGYPAVKLLDVITSLLDGHLETLG